MHIRHPAATPPGLSLGLQGHRFGPVDHEVSVRAINAVGEVGSRGASCRGGAVVLQDGNGDGGGGQPMMPSMAQQLIRAINAVGEVGSSGASSRGGAVLYPGVLSRTIVDKLYVV